ncbi:hypothetical protein ACIF8T_24555 [Streptomyces sp. NPDC085946]|uniref:hypothetical protein n=1 Tax=Streptomyces sp. NPDC085946 TaxID=3365744 RepID=UPI0037D1CC73
MDTEKAVRSSTLTEAPWERTRVERLPQWLHAVRQYDLPGLHALAAGIEAPSLPLLAGLARGEYPQARELFDLVLEELGLLPPTLKDLAERDGPWPSGGPAGSWRAYSIPCTERS